MTSLLVLAIVLLAALELVSMLALPIWLFYRVTTRRGPGRPVLALTIDDGPNPQSTPRWLEALAKHDIKATFFCPGARLASQRELARAIVQAGHELANHSYTHSWALPFFSERRAQAELQRTQDALAELSPPGPWFRPVAGVLSPPLRAAADRLGLVPVTWTARAYDGVFGLTAAWVLGRLRRGIVPGGILVLHDNPRSPGPELMGALTAMADRAGLRFVTLSEMLERPGKHESVPALRTQRGAR